MGALKYFKLFLSFWLVVMFAGTAASYDIQQGIHGMKWGSSILEYKDLIKVHEWEQAAYYVNSDMYYEAANQMVPAVFYGFYKARLFAVFIKLRSPDQYANLERQFSVRHGAPKITHDQAARCLS